jgi:predicted nuclease of predicted toxin-antitoxin system
MRFLVDTNLPPSLSAWLATEGHDALHTRDIGLELAKDRVIWQYAKDNGYCIVTKDEDFVLLQANDPTGAKVVWVRIGNAIKRVLLQRVAIAWSQVVAQLEAGAKVVELR